MKTTILLTIVILFMLATTAIAVDTTQLRGKFGLGFEASAPTPGLSIKYEPIEPVQVQGIFGIFGNNTYYGGRLLYCFAQPYHTAYIFASASGSLDKYTQTDNIAMPGGLYNMQTHSVHDYSQQYGGGFGLEWFFRGLPELGVSFDIGFADYHEPPGTANFASFIGGMGLHYYPSTQ